MERKLMSRKEMLLSMGAAGVVAATGGAWLGSSLADGRGTGAGEQPQEGTNKQGEDHMLDARHYGAVGDGEQDDTAAVQAVLDQVQDGGTVRFGPGRYKVSGLRLQGKTGVVLAGNGELVGYGAASGGAALRIEHCGNVTVDGLQLTGAEGAEAGKGIEVGNSYNITIRNCRLAGFAAEAISLWGSPDPTESTNHIYDNYLLGNAIGIRTQVNGEYVHISRNKVVNNGTGIIGGLGNCRIDNNQVILNDYGIHLDSKLSSNPDHSSITGNQINHNRCVGLMVENLVSGEQIADNQMLSTIGGAWPVTGKSHSLVLINVFDAVLIGNRIDADSTNGSWIHVDGHKECRYIGNTFHSGAFKEISAGANNYFLGNRFMQPSRLELHPDSVNTLRYGEQEHGMFLGKAESVINRNPFTELLNGWADVPQYGKLSYWKDGEGAIHLQGAVQGGGERSVICVLPRHYRPLQTIDLFAVAGEERGFAAIRIEPSGDVRHLSGSTSALSIAAQFKP